MALTIRLFHCERERIVEPTERPWPFCLSTDCEDRFKDVIFGLLGGQTLADMDIAPWSELGRRSVAEALRLRRRGAIERRESREMEHARTRPRKLRALYPC